MKPLLLIVISYISGILFFDLFTAEYDLFFSLLTGSLLVLIPLIKGIHPFSFFRKFFTISTFLFWFFSGGVQTYYKHPTFQSNYYENFYQEGDQLLVNLQEVSTTSSGKFQKSIGEIKALIHGSDTLSVKGNILCYFETTQRPLQRNSLVLINSHIKPIENKGNIGEFDSQRYWKYKQVSQMTFAFQDQYLLIGKGKLTLHHFFLNCRDYLSKIVDQYTHGQNAAIIKGLVLGDRSSIEYETTQTFSHTGAMHVLAVSGMHVAILVLILNWVLQQFPRWISKRTAIIISLVVVWFYSLMTGFSPSVSRAAWMFTFLMGGALLRRDYHPVNGLLFSALIILIWNPYSLFDIGFELSYFAMIGIFTIFPYLQKQLVFQNKYIQNIWEGTALGIAAQIFTTPFALYYFHQFPNYFWITNIALSLYGTLILAGGLILFLLGYFSLLGKIVGFLLSWVVFSMLWMMRAIEGLPDSVSQGFTVSLLEVCALYLTIILFFWSLLSKKIKLMISILASCLIVLSFTIYNRFENLTNGRFVVFNDKEVVFAIKKGNQTALFYNHQKIDEKKATSFLSSFDKIYPSKVLKTVPFNAQENIQIQMDTLKVNVQVERSQVKISFPTQHFIISTKSQPENQLFKTILLPNIKGEIADHYLEDGAFNWRF